MGVNLLKDFTNTQKKSLVIALGFVLLTKFLPIFGYAIRAYNTAVHELGHAITAWLFGYIAIPRFDFINGGGVTNLIARPFLVILLAFTFVAANLLLIKKKIPSNSNRFIFLGLLVYCIFFFSQWHRLLITFMGLGGEVLISFIIGWYALNNLKTKVDIRYFLYLFLSLSIIQNTTLFVYSLLSDSQSKIKYIDGIPQLMGNPMTNDLVKLTKITGFSLNFFSWILLALIIFVTIKLLRVNQLPKLPKHLFKNYFHSLWQLILEQKKQLLEKFDRL